MDGQPHVGPLAVLADDLTGAADCAARCFAAGLSAQIQLAVSVHDLSELPADRSMSFSSDSRHLPPGAAAERVRGILAPLTARPDVRWYKKIDSTLRGNIGAELDAMLDCLAGAGQIAPAVVSPAFPAQGRGVEAGRLVYPGSSQAVSLPLLLSQQSRRSVAHVDLATVRSGPSALARHMAGLRTAGVEVFAADAMSDEDLDALHAAALAGLGDALFCGSAGLVSVLARSIVRSAGASAATSPSGPPLPAQEIPGHGPVIVAVGSGSPMAHAQIARLSAIPGCLAWQVGAERAAGAPALFAGVSVLLYHLPAPAADVQVEGAQARRMADLLAEATVEAIHRTAANRLVLVGGDTAVHILSRLGVARLDVVAELQPGMPLTVGEGSGDLPAARPRAIVLKAGNHGNEDSLVRIVGDLALSVGV